MRMETANKTMNPASDPVMKLVSFGNSGGTIPMV
jgi:hypothetical protein